MQGAAMNALREDNNAKEVTFSDFEKAMEEVSAKHSGQKIGKVGTGAYESGSKAAEA